MDTLHLRLLHSQFLPDFEHFLFYFSAIQRGGKPVQNNHLSIFFSLAMSLNSKTPIKNFNTITCFTHMRSYLDPLNNAFLQIFVCIIEHKIRVFKETLTIYIISVFKNL